MLQINEVGFMAPLEFCIVIKFLVCHVFHSTAATIN